MGLTFAKVLLKQEKSLLPQKVKQSITMEVKIYGRGLPGEFGNAVDSRVEFSFPVSDSPSISQVVDAASGISFEGTLDLTNATLSISATRDGKTVQGQAAIKDIEILRDGKQTMVASGLYVDGDIDLSLPGSGKVSKFDIFPDRLKAQGFLKPANAGPCN